MMAIFIGNGIYPFGDQSFMHSDMYHQYVPFLEEFVRKVRDGEPLYYSWRIGMGSNYLSLYGYYSASPFNWLMLLLPEKYLIEFMSYMVVFKIGLCGFTFSWLLTEKFHTNDLSVLFFSTFYAMSGFVAAYNWNVMWMDTLVLAPLIVLGLEKLVFEKIQPLLHHPRAVHFIELLPFHHGLHLPVPVLSRARAEPVWL